MSHIEINISSTYESLETGSDYTLTVVSNPTSGVNYCQGSTEINFTKQSLVLPEIGDILTFDGCDHEFRVLDISGTTVKVADITPNYSTASFSYRAGGTASFPMYSTGYYQALSTLSISPANKLTYSNGSLNLFGTDIPESNSIISNYYNSLPSDLKSKIINKTNIIDSYIFNSVSSSNYELGNPKYKTTALANYISKSEFVAEQQSYIHPITLTDLINYYNYGENENNIIVINFNNIKRDFFDNGIYGIPSITPDPYLGPQNTFTAQNKIWLFSGDISDDPTGGSTSRLNANMAYLNNSNLDTQPSTNNSYPFIYCFSVNLSNITYKVNTSANLFSRGYKSGESMTPGGTVPFGIIDVSNNQISTDSDPSHILFYLPVIRGRRYFIKTNNKAISGIYIKDKSSGYAGFVVGSAKTTAEGQDLLDMGAAPQWSKDLVFMIDNYQESDVVEVYCPIFNVINLTNRSYSLTGITGWPTLSYMDSDTKTLQFTFNNNLNINNLNIAVENADFIFQKTDSTHFTITLSNPTGNILIDLTLGE